MGEEMNITEDEAALYDRQIRLWGLDAQRRLRAAKVLLIGLKGLGAEITKNIVLAGIKSITLFDNTQSTEEDSCSQFLISRDDVGKNRAEASLEHTQRLNPMVEVTADSQSVEEKADDFFTKFDVVCATCCKQSTLLRIDKICSDHKIKFFGGDVFGFYGFMFSDLGEHEYAEEVPKPKPKEEEGEPAAKKAKKEEIEMVTVKKSVSFSRLQSALDVDWSSQSAQRKLKRTPSTYFILQVLHDFMNNNNRRPDVKQKENDIKLLIEQKTATLEKLKLSPSLLSDDFASFCFAELSPVCAIVGGVMGQEIIKRQLAELLISIGSIGGALEVFERVQLWEDVITCYKRLGKMEKAETLIRDQLAIQETPNLWCFLGDVTRDVNHYIKAWEMSGQKHARSQRCMGYLYMAQEEYEKCIECFQKSLNINSLQVPVWFTLGCACMAAKKFEEAVRAFKRCVNIDTDNFEAWNNMASAYVQLKDKKKALLTLKESLKCNYENWRVWENLLVVATDCGEFDEAIRAYHRLIDLKEKWTDVEVLAVLVKGVTGEYRDPQGNPTSQYKTRLLELFGRITAKVPSNGEIWRLYAELTNSLETQTPETQQKVLQYLQKSQRCLTQEVNWEKSLDKCMSVGEQSLELADLYLGFSSRATEESLPLLQSAKMMLKSVQAKIKLTHTDPISESIPSEDLREVANKMEDKLQTITARATELRQ